MPGEPLTVSAYQFIAFHQEIHRISQCYSRFDMFLNGRVIMKWRVVECQALMLLQQIR